YEPGAFTDARKAKPGLFEVANGGTVFLDEVGELPMTVQTKLLKVLEQKTIRRLGGIQENKINVRVVAATNRDLKREVQEGRFRADLYYRLNVANIVLPLLKSRPEDVEGLARFFFSDFSKEFNKKLRPLSNEILESLKTYHWPGNVRELKNAMERAVLSTRGEALTIKDFPPEIFEPAARLKTAAGEKGALNSEDAEKENIRQVLLACKGHKTKAAEYLGVSRTTLLSKIKKYNLE
ncbi:MAG TPA: sigma 54-interacting transcriptional regulator, partial [bacterium]|nr:sigma 54-interacting transcriptional regulator [bacterium]